jgi:ATP-dependent Lon protease
MTITGNLGTVMKRIGYNSIEYIKANAHLLDLNPDILSKYNIHFTRSRRSDQKMGQVQV